MPCKAIIFDHDGTLVDSEGIHFHIWQSLLKSYGVNFSKQAYLEHHCGVPTLTNAHKIVAHYTIDLTAEDLYARKQHTLSAWLKHQPFPLMPGVLEALQLCRRQHLKIGLATGAGQLETQTTLHQHALTAFFDAVVTRDDVTRSKPAPDTYLQAAQALGLAPEDCVAIEDSFTGLSAAKAAGMRCITVAYEYAKQHDLSQADGHAPSLPTAVALALAGES